MCADLLRHPPGYRPLSGSDFQASPAWLNSRGGQTVARARIKRVLCQAQSLPLRGAPSAAQYIVIVGHDVVPLTQLLPVRRHVVGLSHLSSFDLVKVDT